MKIFKVVSTLALATTLGACGYDPNVGLNHRINSFSRPAAATVAAVQERMVCPKGTVEQNRDVQIGASSDLRYREEHGRNKGRYAERGNRSTYSSVGDVSVRADVRHSSKGTVKCVPDTSVRH